MLGWIFRKKSKAQEPAPAGTDKKAPPVAVVAAPVVDWAARLAQARGDDEALLGLARATGVPLSFKQAAVEALAGEAALKAAELEFRGHDRRVHQLAKRRWQAAVARRQTCEQAEHLIETARGLAGELDVAVNRRVELDRAWQALDATLIEPVRVDEFTALTTRLAAQARERSDLEVRRKRWLAEAAQALQQLRSASAEAAGGRCARTGLADAVGIARGVVAAQPADEASVAGIAGALADLQQALDTAAALDERLAVLDRLLAGPVETPAEAAVDEAAVDESTVDESTVDESTVDESTVDAATVERPPEQDEAPVAGAEPGADGTPDGPADDEAHDPARGEARDEAGTDAGTDAPDPGDPDPAALVTAAPSGPPPTLSPTLSPAPLEDAVRAWQALAPLADAPLAAALAARFADWQRSRDLARQAGRGGAPERSAGPTRDVLAPSEGLTRSGRSGGASGPAPGHPQGTHPSRGVGRAQPGLVLADAIGQAETALEAGQLADAQRHLGLVDDELQGTEAPEALRARLAAAQARLAQLRGWQHWAGARARDELVLQAEALAAATISASARPTGAEAEAPPPGEGGPGEGDSGGPGPARDERPGPDRAVSEVDADVARLSIRQRIDVIDTLRARWKELDRLGGAGARALWPRFDAALKQAYEPVAAQVAAQRAAREANLAARRQLLDGLDALGAGVIADDGAVPEPAFGAQEAAQPPSQAPFQAQSGEEMPVDARTLATALDRFQAEWRKLGPLEHTVPRAARAALVERMTRAVRHLEAPLEAARRRARAQREVLVERARTLASEGAGRGRDFVGEVRALQGEWQQHAKALPLARADEQALWTAFKTAIDAAFAAREAHFSARDAEFEGHAAERAALIERLQLRPEDSPAAQRRTLAEVDAAWQRCGPAPRARAAALEAEFQSARDALRQWLDDSAQRAWSATCDALEAKLALCLAREQAGPDTDAQVLVTAWQALPVLPAPLEAALRRRAERAPAPGEASGPGVDELLLQIESAWNLPSPPAFEAARRERKLLALKATLEGRPTGALEALSPEALLARLLGCRDLHTEQRDRLAAVLAAWRRRGPQQAT